MRSSTRSVRVRSAWVASKSSASSKRFTLLAHVEQSHTASIPSPVGFHSPAASHRTGKRLLQQSQEIRFVFALASICSPCPGVFHTRRAVSSVFFSGKKVSKLSRFPGRQGPERATH